MATHILIAAAEALNQEVDTLVLNHTTIHQLRRENRAKLLEDIHADFIESVIKKRKINRMRIGDLIETSVREKTK